MAKGMLREDHPAPIAADAPPQVVCVAGKWDIDRSACEMLAHSLQLDGLPAVVRASGSITSRYVAGLELEGVRVVVLSFFSREPDTAARNLTRLIRARWPQAKVVLGLWGVPPDELDKQRRESLGADAVVASIKEAVGRVSLLVSDVKEEGVEVVQDRQPAATRNQTLKGVALEDMRRLARKLAASGQKVFVLGVHGPSFTPGRTPYARDPAEAEALLARLDGFLGFFRAELGGVAATPQELRRALD